MKREEIAKTVDKSSFLLITCGWQVVLPLLPFFLPGGSLFNPTANIHNYIENLRLLCRRLEKIKIYFPPLGTWRPRVEPLPYLPRYGKHCFLPRKAVLFRKESIVFPFLPHRLYKLPKKYPHLKFSVKISVTRQFVRFLSLWKFDSSFFYFPSKVATFVGN